MKRAYAQKTSPQLPKTPSINNGLWLELNQQQQSPTPTAKQKRLKFSVDNILNLAGQQPTSSAGG
jgi:hypothetical protein